MGPGNIPPSYEPKGRLWRYDPDGKLHQMESGVICGNGIGWSPDNKTSTFFPVLKVMHLLTIESVFQ